MTNANQLIVEALASFSPSKYSYAPDVLPVAEGTKVRLVRNVNVGAGLVNSAQGTARKIIFDNADVSAVLSGGKPAPYCIVTEFDGFQACMIIII